MKTLIAFAATCALVLGGFAQDGAIYLARGGRVTVAEGLDWGLSPALWGNNGKMWGSYIGKVAPTEKPCAATYDFLFKGKEPFSRGCVRLEGAGENKVRAVFAQEVFGGDVFGGAGAYLSFPREFSNCTWSVNGGVSQTLANDARLTSDFCKKPVKARELRIGSPQGTLRIEFPEATYLQYRGPRHDSASYCFRFGPFVNGKVEKDHQSEFACLLSIEGVTRLEPRIVLPYVAKAGQEWIPFDYKKDIVAGSAADFSSVTRLDAPAGKYGWLKRVGGHFEYEKRPGQPVRYWGANLTGGACFAADDAAADRLADRLVRIGYNSVRIHHHDWRCSRGFGETGELSESGMAQLDSLLAACFKRGLYATADFYVSRDVSFKSIGENRPGGIGHNGFKAYVLFHEGAYSNYCAFAAKFLNHVNAKTGRAYKDEPALNLISLVNEGLFFATWRSIVKEPKLRQAWKDWLTADRAKDPSCFPDYSPDAPPEGEYNQKIVEGPRADVLTAFSVHMELKFYAKMTKFLRELGCKALFTDVNFGPSRPGMREMRHAFDYIDTHFYYEHPKKLGDGVSFGANAHPFDVDSERGLVFERKRFADRPFTISEYNWCGPCQYRAIGSLLGAGVAARQGWDGVWRFAYSQGDRNLADNYGVPASFDVSTDPIMLGMERAAAALYLRGDLAAAPKLGAPTLRELSSPGFEMDFSKGSLSVDTPRTAGGSVRAGGTIRTDTLTFKAKAADAAIWVSSLDGQPLARSARLTLFHLTEALGDGATFVDRTRRCIVERGKGVLLRRGLAGIRLRLDRPETYAVYALDSVGNRLDRVPTTCQDGELRFVADVRGPSGARYQYEIVKEF